MRCAQVMFVHTVLAGISCTACIPLRPEEHMHALLACSSNALWVLQ